MKLEVQIKMNASLYLRDPEQSELGKKFLQLFMIVILLFKILLLFLSYKLKIHPK